MKLKREKLLPKNPQKNLLKNLISKTLRRKLVAGLGNPGSRYKNTRHNIGFSFVQDYLKSVYNFTLKKNRWKGISASLKEGENEIHFLLPQTFMNLSGTSIIPFMKHYNISSENLIVVHDDLDLPLGKVRFRTQGSSAGHLGIESVIHELQDKNFCRLRIGIGKPSHSGEVHDYVLDTFTPEERDVLPGVLEKSALMLQGWFHGGPKGARDTLSRFSA